MTEHHWLTPTGTLHTAKTLVEADETPAIIYIETGADPLTVTRAQFKAQVQQYADGLYVLGVRTGDLVVIAHTQSMESIYLFWAALLLDAIPSMFPTLTEKLDPDIYTRSMDELVSNSGVKAVFTTDDFAPTLRNVLTCDVHSTGQVHEARAQDNVPMRPPAPPNPSLIAFLQHSSGTTGLQKGVALSHAAVLNQIESYSEAIALNDDDVIVSWLPLYHDMGLIAGFIMPLVQGVPLVLMSPFDWVGHPTMLLRAITDYAGTLCWLPNFAYNHMARRIRKRDLEGVDLSSMRMFINCSEPVRADSHALFAEKFSAQGVTRQMLTVSYAMAENTFAVTQTPPGLAPAIDTVDAAALEEQKQAIPIAEGRAIVSCGKPITGTQVRVLDDNGTELPERHVGELAVKSNCMLTEYYKRPDLNPFTADGWYVTGDMGYMADGEVYVIGRKKDLIINAGKNVYPQDIEAIVNTVPGVKPGRAVVFGVPDEREGTEILAVVAELLPDHDTDAVKKAIRQQVATQSTVSVSYVTLVDDKWLIKTSSGKIARAANRDKWMSEHER
ncbi:MAG: AMP-binding protein [Chloroflexota bacterium]